MNLIIDNGNSFCKLAIFRDNKLMDFTTAAQGTIFYSVRQFVNNYPVQQTLIAETADLPPKVIDYLNEKFFVVRLDQNTRLPFQNNYETPKTLGADRKGLVAAAQKFYPKENVLIIDAGTCITYDFLEKGAIYCGGAISPGLKMRYEAMHHFTEKLPLPEVYQEGKLSVMATRSMDNIHSGAVWGMRFEIQGYIQKVQTQYPNTKVVLTGGDKNLLADCLKNSIFAPAHFLMNGLNRILEYNRPQ